jgi:tetratricopeptide (TPR) repeat protein
MWSGAESNRRHVDFQSTALPTELPDHLKNGLPLIYMPKLSIIKYAFILSVFLGTFFAGAPGADARNTWEFYYEKGLAQYKLEIYDAAIFNMIRCLDANPRCYEAANVLADIYDKKNNKSQAVKYYKQSLAINDAQADVHYTMGILYEFFNERSLAFRHFTRAVEIDPLHVRAHCGLVRYYVKENDRAAADRHFEISHREGMAKSGGLLSTAIEADKGGDNKKAITLYTQVIDEAPALVEAYMNLYEVRMRRKEHAAAAGVMERLKYVKPDHEKAYVLLGYLYFTQKLPGSRKYNLERAIDNLKKAVVLNPENCETYYSIAEIYKYMGKGAEAREWEKKGLAVEEGKEEKE